MLQNGTAGDSAVQQCLRRGHLAPGAGHVERRADLALQPLHRDADRLFIIGDRRAIDRQLPVEPAQRDVVVRQFGLQAQAAGCQRRGARLGEALLGARAVADLAPEIGLPRRPRQNLVAGLPNGLVGVRGAEQPLLGLLVVGQQSVRGHLREQAGPRLGGHVAGLRVFFGHRGEIGVLRGQLLLELVEPGIIEPLPPRAARQCVERMGDLEGWGTLIARRQDVLRRPIRRRQVAAAESGKSRQHRARHFQRRSGGGDAPQAPPMVGPGHREGPTFVFGPSGGSVSLSTSVVSDAAAVTGPGCTCRDADPPGAIRPAGGRANGGTRGWP